MKKVIYIFIFCVILVTKNNAQKFMHGFGATISNISTKLSPNLNPVSSSNYYNFSLLQSALTYYPRYNFIENKNSSLSLGIPLSVGIGVFSTTTKSDAGIVLSYDLPLAIDYNIGFKSTRVNPKKFGYFFGTGFGYSNVNLSSSQYSNYSGSSYGILYRAGVRFGSSRADWKGMGIMIGMFYKKGLEDEKFSTIGTHVLVDF